MADPVTLFAVMAGVGALTSGLSAVQEGRAAGVAHEYSARIVERKSAQEEKASREKTRKLLGTQRALFAKAGVDISEGSPLLIMAETAREGEEEALAIRRGGKEEARLERFYGRQAKKAGRMRGISTFLTGLGQTGLGFYAARK